MQGLIKPTEDKQYMRRCTFTLRRFYTVSTVHNAYLGIRSKSKLPRCKISIPHPIKALYYMYLKNTVHVLNIKKKDDK